MNAVKNLRIIGNIEGISYILLLFIAMPLKYFAGMPMAVRFMGSIHGFLFVLFIIALILATRAKKWPYEKAAFAFLMSIIPFGTFYLDRKLRAEE
jgi:integral membrane protein